MQYQVEDLDQLTKNIDVTVPSSEVDAVMDKVAKKFRSGMNVPGFRKGKAPLRMIERQHSKDIRSEATNTLIDGQVRGIIEELKLEPALDPSLNAELVERGKDYLYSFKVELMPVFDLPDYQDFPVDQQEAEVSEQEIEGVLEKARKDMAELLPVLDKRNPQDGDLVHLDFVGYDEEGKEMPGFKAENAQIPLGDNQAFENFEKLIKTVPMGEEGNGDVEFPADFPDPSMAGKKINFKLRINALYERKLPDLDDEFAKQVGNFENMDKLREMIRGSFLDSRNQNMKTTAQQAMLDKLLQNADFPLPQGLVERYSRVAEGEIMERIRRTGGQGMGDLLKNPAKIKEEARNDAERYVRSSIFLFRVAQAEKLEVSDQELDQHIRYMAQQQGKKPEELFEELYRNNALSSVHERILTSKALQTLYEKAKITMVPHPVGLKVVKVKSKPEDKAGDKPEDNAEARPKTKSSADTDTKPESAPAEADAGPGTGDEAGKTE